MRLNVLKNLIPAFTAAVLTGALMVASAPSTQALQSRYLNGTFIQIEGATDNWGTTEYNSLLGNLVTVKMDHVILQYVAKSDTHTTFYPKGFTPTADGSTWTQSNPGKDPVGACLAAAKAKGLKVWLGLGWDQTNWFNNNPNTFTPWQLDDAYINKLLEQYDVVIAKDLWTKYKGTYATTIAGFYFAEEIDNVISKQNQYQYYIGHLYNATLAIKTATGKPVMIAPFFIASSHSASNYAVDMSNIVAGTGVDVVAVQDGVGAGNATVTQAQSWFAALKTQFTSQGIGSKLWSDLETFDVNFNPAPISRVADQVNREAPSVAKFTSFTFAQYDTPDFGHTAEFNAYKSWLGVP